MYKRKDESDPGSYPSKASRTDGSTVAPFGHMMPRAVQHSQPPPGQFAGQAPPYFRPPGGPAAAMPPMPGMPPMMPVPGMPMGHMTPMPMMAAHGGPDAGKSDDKKEKKGKKEAKVAGNRAAAGEVWLDKSMDDWDPNDFRLFCGDLGNEVGDEMLGRAFSKYPSMQKSRVIRDKKTGKSKGFGFVSFRNPDDFLLAMREMNGKYIGNRPVKLRKSTWQDRDLGFVKATNPTSIKTMPKLKK
eukprot:m.230319 g.230319  ORF g.230319 m.230319 type:complete len:242 (-) comp12044_c0_seq1:110-835(-)